MINKTIVKLGKVVVTGLLSFIIMGLSEWHDDIVITDKVNKRIDEMEANRKEKES